MDLFYLLYKMCRVRKIVESKKDELFFFFQEPFYDLSFSSNIAQCSSCAIESDSTAKSMEKEVLFQMKQIHLSSVDIELFQMNHFDSSFQNISTAGDYSPLPICVKHLPESFLTIAQLYKDV